MEEARKARVRAGASSIHRRCKQASKEAKQQANIPRAAHLQSFSPVRSSLCVTTTTGTALATKWLRVRTTAMSCFPVSFRATNCNVTEPTQSSNKLPKKLLKELQISPSPKKKPQNPWQFAGQMRPKLPFNLIPFYFGSFRH
jgi:hypothetical protein